MKVRSIYICVLIMTALLLGCDRKQESLEIQPTVTLELIDVQATKIARSDGGNRPLDYKDFCESPAEVRWFIGLGGGAEPSQQQAQNELVSEFNEQHKCIKLVHEVTPNEHASTVLTSQIERGHAPAIIGPLSLTKMTEFEPHLADLSEIRGWDQWDRTEFSPEVLEMYHQNGKQLAVPFSIFPSFIFFNTDLFDEVGLPYPPQVYGEKIELNGELLEWNVETVAEIAQYLTLDENGLNATEDEFDPEAIVQFGYGNQWASLPGRLTLFGSGSFVSEDGTTAQIPTAWREAAHWYHKGMHEQIFHPSGAYDTADLFGGDDNYFNSGNIAMAQTHLWYTCCFDDLEANWDFAISPANSEGITTAKMHADTFHIMEDSDVKEEALYVLHWMLTEKIDDLIRLYNIYPAQRNLQDAFFDKLVMADSGVNWQVVKDSERYSESPHHDEWIPNHEEAQKAIEQFYTQLKNDRNLDVNAGLDQLQTQLQRIFDGGEFDSSQSMPTTEPTAYATIDPSLTTAEYLNIDVRPSPNQFESYYELFAYQQVAEALDCTYTTSGTVEDCESDIAQELDCVELEMKSMWQTYMPTNELMVYCEMKHGLYTELRQNEEYYVWIYIAPSQLRPEVIRSAEELTDWYQAQDKSAETAVAYTIFQSYSGVQEPIETSRPYQFDTDVTNLFGADNLDKYTVYVDELENSWITEHTNGFNGLFYLYNDTCTPFEAYSVTITIDNDGTIDVTDSTHLYSYHKQSPRYRSCN